MTTTQNPQSHRRLIVLAVTLLVVGAAPIAAADEHVTGIDRAFEAASNAQAKAKERAAEAHEAGPGSGDTPDADAVSEVPPGLQRANEAVSDAVDRKKGKDQDEDQGNNGNHNGHENGDSHGWGGGHSAKVHAALLAGGSPSELESHGQSVRAMVHAYNEMRKQFRVDDTGKDPGDDPDDPGEDADTSQDD